jgi:uncharacterized delta-60 repeat protein
MRRRRSPLRLAAAAALLSLLALAPPALAAPGQPDLTFGFDGFRTIDLGGDDFANALAVQPDGAVVLAGWSTVEGNQRAALSRLTARGVPDPSFNGDGRFIYDITPNGNDFANAVALQPDGKIVFAGTAGGSSLADVGRLHANGSFDPSFDGDGHRGHDWGGTDVATSLAVRPDGRIVVAGHTTAGENIVVQQVAPDGLPDLTFGGPGGATRIDRGGDEETGALALQPDGKVVVAGWTAGPAGVDLIVTRLTPGGAIDTSFAGTGTVVVNLGGDEWGNAVAVAPDGRIVVAGTVRFGARQDFLLVRLNPDGSFDSSFGVGGRSILDPVGRVDDGRSLALQPDGKIVFIGTVFTTATEGFAEVERVTADGAWDPTFHEDGHTGFNFVGGGGDHGRAIALAPSGNIVVAGSTTVGQNFGAARLEGGPFQSSPPPPPPGDSDGDGVPDPSDRCPSVPRGRFDANGDGCVGPYRRIDVVLRGGWAVLRRGIRIATETASRVPVGATVRLRCATCKVRQTLRARRSRITLTRLRGKLLGRGKSFSVRVTAPGHIGQVKTLTVKRYGKSRRARNRVSSNPFRTVSRCIPIGSRRPARRCDATPPTGP